jgi:hypothetical protein
MYLCCLKLLLFLHYECRIEHSGWIVPALSQREDVHIDATHMVGLIDLAYLKGHWNLRLIHFPICVAARLITPNPKTTLHSRYAMDMSDHDHKIQTRSKHEWE